MDLASSGMLWWVSQTDNCIHSRDCNVGSKIHGLERGLHLRLAGIPNDD
jgi:hypothetical protein